MPDDSQADSGVSNKSHSQTVHSIASGTSRRSSSTISLRPRNRSPSPSSRSNVPLTPEESPPFKSTRKRSAGAVEQKDKAIASAEASPAHARSNSGDTVPHVCLCQPDPKIPRPRNAFILYRQHHQANVVAQHPGLANPEISKIIGERWQSLPTDEKNKWKGLAEEEKIRHQHQYPTYRYQPKRNGRRNSLSSDFTGPAGEKLRCTKCGGRTISTPSNLFSAAINTSVPSTPGTATITPVSRTLPVLKDLSLQSPQGAYLGRQQQTAMSPSHGLHSDNRDDIGPLSPDAKRRRFNVEHPVSVTRTMPPRYGTIPAGGPVGPGTPFPFGQSPSGQHQYSSVAVHNRRESLPGLRGMVSPPGPMAPPPRPGMGYQAHRMSQGHVAPDRSLTLPPIQSGHGNSLPSATDGPRTAEEQIMASGFRYKIRVLSQVAPPASKSEIRRGALIAVEGDSADAAKELAEWLTDTLSKESDLVPHLIEGPDVRPHGSKEEMMAQYHRLVGDWLMKSSSILQSLTMQIDVPADAKMTDAAHDGTSGTPEGKEDAKAADAGSGDRNQDNAKQNDKVEGQQEKMEIDKRSSTISTVSSVSDRGPKHVAVVPNFSLHASNRFACAIPLGGPDPYSPHDHWQWAATQWRGIIGPDVTIYVRDAESPESGRPPFEIDVVEGKAGATLVVVRRTKDEEQKKDGDAPEAKMHIEPPLLRRLGFEVSEVVRAFDSRVSKARDRAT